LKALTKPATEVADEQFSGRQDAWSEGRRELTTTQVANLLSTGRSWMYDWTREVPANVNYQGGRLCAGGRVNRATANAWCPVNQTATKGWRRDPPMPVSSLLLTPVAESLPDFSCRSVCPAGEGRGWLGLTSGTTISAHGAFSTGRVLVGRGR
jgi:hypothetical protein